MDRNSYIGLGLIFLLLIGYFYINQPNEKEQAVQKHYADSLQNVKQLQAKEAESAKILAEIKKDSLTATLLKDSNALKATYGGLASQVTGKEEEISLENDELRITFTNKGEGLSRSNLKITKPTVGNPFFCSIKNSVKIIFHLQAKTRKLIRLNFIGPNSLKIVILSVIA